MSLRSDSSKREVKVWLPEEIASELAYEAARREPSNPSKSAVVADVLGQYFGKSKAKPSVRRRPVTV